MSEAPRNGKTSSELSWLTSVEAALDSWDPSATEVEREAAAGFERWAADLWIEGQPIDFDRFPWMREPYTDPHPEKVARKCTQTGWTVWAVLMHFHGLLTKYRYVLYYMPTKDDVGDLVRTRVNPLIEDNAKLRDACKFTNNIGVKRVGPSWIYFRGIGGKAATKSVPADAVVLDELDEMIESENAEEDDVIAQARGRMEASLWKHMTMVGNPTFPDYGIDAAYSKSDQRSWHLRCPHCSRWKSPDLEMPKKLREDVPCIGVERGGRHFLRCSSCGGELDPNGEGRWVPAVTGEDGIPHGYTMGQIVRPGCNLAAFLAEYRTTTRPMAFFNLGAGIPWISAENRITKEQVLALCTDRPPGTGVEIRTGCAIGIDPGKVWHWVVTSPILGQDEKENLVDCGEAENLSELQDVYDRYPIKFGVVDGNGAPDQDDLKRWLRGKPIFRCFFNEHARTAPRWDDDDRKVVFNRTEALDLSRAVVRLEELSLPHRNDRLAEFALHQERAAKKLVVDKATGDKRHVYVKLGPDHYAMALTYCVLASKRRGLGFPLSSGSAGNLLDDTDRPPDNLLTKRF